MKANKKDLFLQSIQQDSPILKLVKYQHLIQTSPQIAKQLKTVMCQLALNNKLVVVYREINQKLKLNDYQVHPMFQKLRENMVNDTNSLHNDVKNYRAQNNNEKLAQTLLKLGFIYFSYGDFKQTSIQLNNLSMLNASSHNIKYQEYATELALSFYYMGQFYSLSRFNSRPIDKSVLKKLVDVCIIRDINNFEYHKKHLDNPFKNILQMQFTNMDLNKNRVMGYNDLGFIYSLLTIAYKKKQDISFVKWSYKLQNQFLNNKYKHVLETLQKQKQKRCFLPIIQLIYEKCQAQIRKRILLQIITSFDRCPFKIIQQMTGINQGQVRLFVQDNPNIPLLFDPITRSVVYNRDTLPLYSEVKTLYERLKRKFDQQLSAEMRDDEDGRRGSRGFGGMMGMMGMMGGMGRMRSRDF